MDAENLIQDLIERTRININKAESFKALSIEELNWRPGQNSWSILECFEHLNLYGDFYIPEIKTRINQSSNSTDKIFKTGLLGNYFAKSMLPKEKLNKMKTFKDKNPIGSSLDARTIDRFLSQQYEILNLLDKSRKVNLNKTKTGITISSWIKLKLGDTFRVVIYHNDRHLLQVQNVLDSMKKAKA